MIYECGSCGLWKLAADFFRDVRYTDRWMPRSTCKTCMKAKRKASRVHWTAKVCTGCNQMVPLGGYYIQAGSPHMPCKTCRASYQPPARTVSEKRCAHCGQTKPSNSFPADRRKATGLASRCRECTAEWRPETMIERSEKRCTVCHQTKPASDYYKDATSKDGLYSRCKTCHNKRAYAGQRLYKATNIEQVRKWQSDWRRSHPEFGQAHGERRRARKKNAPISDFTRDQWLTLKAAYQNCCAYCGKKTRLTIDHVIPLALGGAHTASNIVPACKSCNSRKHTGEAPTYQTHLLA